MSVDALVDKTGINPTLVDDVIFGCVSQVFIIPPFVKPIRNQSISSIDFLFILVYDSSNWLVFITSSLFLSWQ